MPLNVWQFVIAIIKNEYMLQITPARESVVLELTRVHRAHADTPGSPPCPHFKVRNLKSLLPRHVRSQVPEIRARPSLGPFTARRLSEPSVMPVSVPAHPPPPRAARRRSGAPAASLHPRLCLRPRIPKGTHSLFLKRFKRHYTDVCFFVSSFFH